jgi:hypothetical protein
VETYKCLDCERLFTGPSGPTVCSYCGSLKVEWQSYGKTAPEKITPEQKQQETAEQMFKGIFWSDKT